jgi:hypothetical protein
LSENSERAFSALTALLPPLDDPDPKRIRRWRVWLALVVIMNVSTFTAHVLLACGYLPMMFPGFANAGELKELQKVFLEQRVAALETTILETRKQQCAASPGTVRALYTNSLQKLVIDYEKITYTVEGRARQYPVPDCTAF